MKSATKKATQAKARKASAKRRVAVALAKYLKQQNPAAKLAGAKVEKLAGGVLKITPIKANGARGAVVSAASALGRAVRGRPFTTGRKRKNSAKRGE
jgi:hypothetical protein